MAECRAAHAFGVEVIGLLNGQSAGSNRGERRAAAYKEQVSSACEHLREVLYVFFPAGQVMSNRGAGGFKVLVACGANPRWHTTSPSHCRLPSMRRR